MNPMRWLVEILVGTSANGLYTPVDTTGIVVFSNSDITIVATDRTSILFALSVMYPTVSSSCLVRYPLCPTDCTVVIQL